jgi:uncharacterized membrane protein
MVTRSLRSVATTWLAGLLLLLPLALTLAVLGWALNLVNGLVGPGSFVGGLFAKLGYPFAAIYLLGLVAQMGLRGPLKSLADRTVRRVPVLGGLYNLADRFVGLLDQKQSADIGAMRPVWCFFGGDGVATLALAPSAQTIDIEGRAYYAVLIPTAPVPFGGALLYVPAAWVRPANIGVDKLTAIYVSMGITPPTEPTLAKMADPQRTPAGT